MKTKSIKKPILELFLKGPGTRLQVWERDTSVCDWERFKRVTSALRFDGFLETIPQSESPGNPIVRLTAKGRKSIAGQN